MMSVSVMWRRPTVHAHQIVNAEEMLVCSSLVMRRRLHKDVSKNSQLRINSLKLRMTGSMSIVARR